MWEIIGELEQEDVSGEALAANIVDETGLDIKSLLDELWLSEKGRAG